MEKVKLIELVKHIVSLQRDIFAEISRLPRLLFLSCIGPIRRRKLAKNTGRVKGLGGGPTITKQAIEIIVSVFVGSAHNPVSHVRA